MAKLFIVGFPKDLGEIELVELFSLHGAVNTLTVVTDKVTGAPKGYAFVTMHDTVAAERAIRALNGLNMGGRTLSVRFAEEKKAVSSPGGRNDRQPFLRTPSPRRDNRIEPPRPRRPRRPL